MILSSVVEFLCRKALLCSSTERIFIFNKTRGNVQSPVLGGFVHVLLNCFYSDHVAVETRQRHGRFQLLDHYSTGNTSTEISCVFFFFLSMLLLCCFGFFCVRVCAYVFSLSDE